MGPRSLSSLAESVAFTSRMIVGCRGYDNSPSRADRRRPIVWALLLPLAPFAASQPAPARVWYALAFVVYGAGSVVCHQLPERSFRPVVGADGRSARGARASMSGRRWRRSFASGFGGTSCRRVGSQSARHDRSLAVAALPTRSHARATSGPRATRRPMSSARWPARRSAPRSSSSLSARCASPERPRRHRRRGPPNVN